MVFAGCGDVLYILDLCFVVLFVVCLRLDKEHLALDIDGFSLGPLKHLWYLSNFWS